MTKKQEVSRARAGLTVDRVLTAAFDVLDRGGAGKLSTRAIAAELGVSMNTVLWHIRTKERLLELMAEFIVGEVDLDDLPSEWPWRATELLHRLRRAMLNHRDGAAIVAGTFPAEPNTLAFADRLLSALIEQCPTPRVAAWTAWNLFYFTLGLVQEEQAAPTAWHEGMDDIVDTLSLPALSSVWAELISVDFEERFDFGIRQILHSASRAQEPWPDSASAAPD